MRKVQIRRLQKYVGCYVGCIDKKDQQHFERSFAMSEVMKNDDKIKSERKMIGNPTVAQMCGVLEDDLDQEGTLPDKAYGKLWQKFNEETPKESLLKTLNRKYRDGSCFYCLLGDILEGKIEKFTDGCIVETMNAYIAKQQKEFRNFEIIKLPKEDENERLESMWEPLKPRRIGSWIDNRNSRPNNEEGRLVLYKLSFALGLNWEEHDMLFSKVFRMKTYLRTPIEFCLTYCKKNGFSYVEAVNLYIEYCIKRKEPDASERMVYKLTKVIGDEIFSLEERGQFLDMIINNGDSYFVKSETILQEIGLKKEKNIEEILKRLNAVGYSFHDDEKSNKKLKSKLSDKIASEFFISISSALKSSRRRKNSSNKTIEASNGRKYNLQLRKIYILLKLSEFIQEFIQDMEKKNFSKEPMNHFVEFIANLDVNLININLPQLYYRDDFDRGIILAAVYITICSGWGKFKESDNKLSDLITSIIESPKKQV